ncbi:MAG TPA: formate dehydrogenase accessory sulfurtransferase FdhD [Firmicutes bacterium]|nr:formate dehydrogenase accessory sulfurtransferase FdhD [Candidatus Fermentithermobacillaceae bacterium]
MGHTSDYADYTEVPAKRFFESGTDGQRAKETSDTVIAEASLTVLYRNVSVNIPSCSPSNTSYLAVGHLITGGLIRYADRVSELRYLPGEDVIYVETEQAVTQGTPPETTKVPQTPEPPELPEPPDPLELPELRKRPELPELHKLPEPPEAATVGSLEYVSPALEPCPMFNPGAICDIFDDLLQRSSLFKMTGACHAAALCDENGIVLWHEDIGRHNAVDKVIGHAFLEKIPLNDKMLAITGRINSEIVDKVVSANIPVVASKAPPTDVAVRTAQKAGVTVIGFVRNRRMTVYSNSERVVHKNPTDRNDTDPG